MSAPPAAPPPGSSDTSESAGRQPWWIPPFLGRVPPEITERQIRLVGVVALALAFEYYDLSMLGAALKDIRESFGLPQSEGGRLTALVRLGALPAIFLVLLADRIGRRRLFLGCIVGTSLATLLTAFTQTAYQFVAIQMVARVFLIGGSATAFVIVSEELPAAHRGWAIGILGALGSLGFGLGALVFAAIDWLPYGWRTLYVLGIAPLLLLPMFRREVSETQRFRDHQAAVEAAPGAVVAWWQPFWTMLRLYPGRTLAIALVGLFSAGAHAPAHQLLGDYVRTDHGWEPFEYSAMFICGGLLGIIGNTTAGRLADRLGRRVIGFLVLALFPLFALGFYQGSGWVLPLMWIPLVFTSTGGNTIIRAVSTELFPTSARGTATGSLSFFETVGAALGLLVVTLLTPVGESSASVISGVVFIALLGAVIMLMLPETARRELEDLAHESRS
ncbi:MAG: MFS transporter [Myxococcota bacterium]